MEITVKLFTNFTQQLKFMSIILGITVLILGINGGFYGIRLLYHIINCITLGITGILFLATTFDALKDTDSLRKFEQIYHSIAGILIVIGSIVTFCYLGHYYSYSNSLSAALIGLLLNGPLNFFLGWQLRGAYEREPESMRPIYLAVGVSHSPMKFVEDLPPPKYTEAYSATLLARRNAPPPTYPQSTTVEIHQQHSASPTPRL